MRCSTIRSHLKAYRIFKRRATTVQHAFAAAVAPHDVFEEGRVREAMGVFVSSWDYGQWGEGLDNFFDLKMRGGV